MSAYQILLEVYIGEVTIIYCIQILIGERSAAFDIVLLDPNIKNINNII